MLKSENLESLNLGNPVHKSKRRSVLSPATIRKPPKRSKKRMLKLRNDLIKVM